MCHQADCENCPSDPSVDPTKCDCDSENFPNNWVDCTDGSGKKFTVEASAAGSNTYTPLVESFQTSNVSSMLLRTEVTQYHKPTARACIPSRWGSK